MDLPQFHSLSQKDFGGKNNVTLKRCWRVAVVDVTKLFFVLFALNNIKLPLKTSAFAWIVVETWVAGRKLIADKKCLIKKGLVVVITYSQSKAVNGRKLIIVSLSFYLEISPGLSTWKHVVVLQHWGPELIIWNCRLFRDKQKIKCEIIRIIKVATFLVVKTERMVLS